MSAVLKSRSNLAAEAHSALRNEMIAALMDDPARDVRWPGQDRSHAPAFEVLQDALAVKSGEAALHELLRIVGLCASGELQDPAMRRQIHLRAAAWIAVRGEEHARECRDDVAEEML